MKKVMHINSFYYGTKLYQRLYENLKNNNSEFYVFAPCDYSFDYNKFTDDYLLKSKCYSKFDRIFFHLKEFKILKEFWKINTNYDMIHAHTLFSNGYIAYETNLKFNVPYIVAVRNTDVNTFFKKMPHLRHLGINILLHANIIIFLSESYKNRVLDCYVPAKYKEEINKKSRIIPNGIDEFWLSNKRKHRYINNGKIRLVFVGNIDKNKNLLLITKMIELYLLNHYEVVLNIIGLVKDKKIFNEVASKTYVKYHGKQDKEYISSVYSESDIFVMVSKTETFGLVYAEAMSQGLPIIYTKGEGFDNQFENGEVGFSADCNDPESVFKAIESIIANYDTISANCFNKCDKFNWDIIAKEYISIYS